jgi:GPH family glycoside/pentoside/hexuronide:cation symporter
MKEERVPLTRLLAYCLPVAPVEAMFWLVVLYQLKFATDVLGVSPATMGLVFGAARLWDGVLDPVAGFASDRTATRLGRRRPWILLSALPLGAAFAAAWSPPAHALPRETVLFVAAGVFSFYTAHAAFGIPHASLGAELTPSHHDRTRVFGVRAAFAGGGMLAGVAALAVLERAPDPRVSATAIAGLLGALAAASALLCGALLRERPELQGRGGRHPWKVIGDVTRNPHARRLLAVFFFTELGVGCLATSLPYASQYVLGTPRATSTYLACFLVPTLLSIPLWVGLSRRIGKHRAWLLSSALSAIGFGAIFTLGPGDGAAIAMLSAAIGLAHGAARLLPLSIQADVIDWDELRSGERKEGAYCAAWNLSAKAAGGLAIALCGALLAASGFEPAPESTGAPPERVLLAIRVAVSLVPAGCLGLATWLLAGFELDETEHRAIRAQLGAARAGSATSAA